MKLNIIILFIICLLHYNSSILNAQTTNYSQSINSYSFDLYRNTKSDSGNILLSPLSTYAALLMVYEGSKNKTKQEFEKVLYLGDRNYKKNQFLLNYGTKSDNGSFLRVSNALWMDKTIKIEGTYKKSLSQKYSSNFEQIDFSNVNLSVSKINEWVSEKTNQTIKEIVKSSDIVPYTKVMISNAVYFKAEWLNKFDRQKTMAAPFFTNDSSQYKIDFMNIKEHNQYYENDDYQFISKSYNGSDFSFCMILPKKLFSLEAIEKKMNADLLKEMTDSSYAANTVLTMPKFKMEYICDLREVLEKMGMQTAFNEAADFSGITKDTSLMLDKVLNKTLIEFDEEITVAAAATVIGIRITGGPPAYKVFKADHPFVFFIMDNRTNTILFLGRYLRPTGGSKIESASMSKNLDNRTKEEFSIGNGFADAVPLYIVDGKVISVEQLNEINPSDIETIDVIKDKNEIRKYTTKNYNGAVVITLKKRKRKK